MRLYNLGASRSLWGIALIFAACGLSPAIASEPSERNIVFFITDDEGPTLGCCGDPFGGNALH